mmetsp:Transcript_37717/g.60812  ORF Transcript_37717/g.60812 Transcript_37717/m.60812 type:complete len:272 (+) Transcript_37717:151-966(+)
MFKGQGELSGGEPIVLDRASLSCVRLQTLLYFSFWFDILFAFIEVLAGWAKWRWIKGPFIVILLGANYVLCFVVEPCRLYLGYAGNLGEKVPELFLFVFMCLSCLGIFAGELVLSAILPELQPANCSYVPELRCILPVEQACWIVRVVLLLGELIIGVRALRRLIHEKSTRFFVSLESEDAGQRATPGLEEEEVEVSGWSTTHGVTGGRRSSRTPATPDRNTRRVMSSPGRGWEGTAGHSISQDESGIGARVLGRQLYSPARTNERRLHAD